MRSCRTAGLVRGPSKIGTQWSKNSVKRQYCHTILSCTKTFFFMLTTSYSSLASRSFLNLPSYNLPPRELLKTMYCDNEPSLKSHTIVSMLCNNFGVSITNASPLNSTSNGQVERFHIAGASQVHKDRQGHKWYGRYSNVGHYPI